MELGKRFLGGPHNDGPHNDGPHRDGPHSDGGHEHGGHEHGGLIRRARLYEFSAAIAFVGLRPRIYDGLVALSGAKPGDRVLDVG
ncbi:hypothetical protein ACFP2T_10395 [Plantactinospora solaniradicis]|uniref:Uncharacterized protein n=1 Tax=Plantactinospora solaniradicis TaxID=1723736 RepID=A0ABW1K6Y0_9ACTN